MNITIRLNDKNKGQICEDVLRTIPEWFGIEEATLHYIKNIENQPMFVAELDGRAVGFLGLEMHFEHSAEIYVMGIKKDYHRNGVGKKLMTACEQYLKEEGTEFLQVKTLSDSDPDEGYAKTRKFYLAMGFYPVEEFKTLWGEANPCLMMIKKL